MGRESNKEYNYGIALLRIWMCFEVICFHLLNGSEGWEGHAAELPFYMVGLYNYEILAVPVFFIVAFIFSSSFDNIGKRLKRLIEPHVFWSTLIFTLYVLLDCIGVGKFGYGFIDLIMQIIFGGAYNKQHWFQIDLIIITLLLYLTFKLLKKHKKYVAWCLLLLAIFCQYNGANLKIYNLTFPDVINPGHVRFMLGRICECLPFATVGVLLCEYNVLKEKGRKTIFIMVMMCGVICLLIKYGVFVNINGYGYQGVFKIVMATATVVLFNYLPLGNILPSFLLRIIKYVASYTMAIYFIHVFIDQALQSLFADCLVNMLGTLSYCVLVFAISLAFGVIIHLIPIKFIKRCCV
nr:acyltransferase family protein [uncultured Butyrivibrio sp.]